MTLCLCSEFKISTIINIYDFCTLCTIPLHCNLVYTNEKHSPGQIISLRPGGYYMFVYTNSKIHVYTSIKVHVCTNIKVHEYTASNVLAIRRNAIKSKEKNDVAIFMAVIVKLINVDI